MAKSSPALHFGRQSDFTLRGWDVRIFWRGIGWRLWLPYAFHRWGFYAFGVWQIGFMVWPPPADSRQS